MRSPGKLAMSHSHFNSLPISPGHLPLHSFSRSSAHAFLSGSLKSMLAEKRTSWREEEGEHDRGRGRVRRGTLSE